ncbi:MAG TPA: hypothetical protein DF613_11830 [Lachnospiraceae bacterium]|nr:hypothetical protein [Lachnospiraceae bacterium]
MKKQGVYKRFTVFILAMVLMTVCISGGVTVQAAPSLKSVKAQADKIIGKQVSKKDSKKQKLKKLFTYVEKNYDYKRTIGFKNEKGWERAYALEMFKGKKGSCYHFAAAYAFLAKRATGYKVRIGLGDTNGFSGKLQDHGWVEIKINSKWYICDPNMDKYAADSSGKYYLKERSKLKKTYDRFKSVKYVNVTF